MRVIGEIPHPEFKITLFHWNNRYLIKLERGLLEQTYKVPEYDLAGEADLQRILSEGFLKAAMDQFEAMHRSLQEALQEL